MQQIPKSAAAALYPHLKTGTPDVVERRQQPSSIANALYPDLAPKSKPPAPKSRPRLTREQAFDWSNVSPEFARMVGLVRKS
jgi:hypothetical protein